MKIEFLPPTCTDPFGIAGIQRELGRDFRNQVHQQGAVETDARAGNVGARGLPHVYRFIVAEFAADLFEDLERLFVDQLDRLVGNDLVDGDLANQRRKRRDRRAAQRLATDPSAATAVGCDGLRPGCSQQRSCCGTPLRQRERLADILIKRISDRPRLS